MDLCYYKCSLCDKRRECSHFICPTCVNSGRFSLQKHTLCTTERCEQLISSLNENDLNQFEKYMTEQNLHKTEIQCFYAMFILKKYQLEKQSLKNQFQLKWKSFFRMNLIKRRIFQAEQHGLILREQIKNKKQLIISMNEHIEDVRSKNHVMKQKLASIKNENKKLEEIVLAERLRKLYKEQNKVQWKRRKYLQQLQTYVCPIELVSTIYGDSARQILCLRDIWNNNDDDETQLTNNVASVELETKKHRIVHSFLSINDDDAINNLVTIYNSAESVDESAMDSFVFINNDIDSPQLLPSAESFETLSALSYACLLTNAIAHILDVDLPFRIHQLEFHKNRLTYEDLRGNIAKLNANIVRICRSQNILVDGKEHCTLDNLYNILQLSSYSSTQSEDIDIFSQTFTSYLETIITNVDGTSNTEYWFDQTISARQDSEDINHLQLNSNNPTTTSDLSQHGCTDLTPTNSDELKTPALNNSTNQTAPNLNLIRSWFDWR